MHRLAHDEAERRPHLDAHRAFGRCSPLSVRSRSRPSGLQRRGDAPVDQCAQQLRQAAEETRERAQQSTLDELQEMHRLSHDEAERRPILTRVGCSGRCSPLSVGRPGGFRLGPNAVFCRHPPRRCPAERHLMHRVFRAAARRCQWDAQAASGSGPNAVFCRHPPRRCPAERLPDASGVRTAARRCQWDAQAASGSGPNAVFCRPRPRRRPAEWLPDRPSIRRHDRPRLSEPGCRRLPATAGRRLATPACRRCRARPGGSGPHLASPDGGRCHGSPSARPSSDTTCTAYSASGRCSPSRSAVGCHRPLVPRPAT